MTCHLVRTPSSIGARRRGRTSKASTAMPAMTHALVVVRSHYPTIDLRAIGAGFARGTGATKQQELEDELEDAAKRLARDVDLLGEVDREGQT